MKEPIPLHYVFLYFMLATIPARDNYGYYIANKQIFQITFIGLLTLHTWIKRMQI